MKNKPGNIVIWEGTDWKSMECLEWSSRGAGSVINSQLMGVIDEEPFHYKYRIETDEQWQTEYFLVHDLLDTNNKLELRSDKNGRWFDNDAELSALQGCRDIDISLTPFTNTLPIRRLHLEKGVKQTIEVLYIKLPVFEISRVTQHYTMLAEDRYVYEGVFRNFVAELPVDSHKMVMDYPGLVKRLYPR
jgi:hypothetical protein